MRSGSDGRTAGGREATRTASAGGQLRALNPLRAAEAPGDLAIGIDASLSGEIDGPEWSVSDRGTAGALDHSSGMQGAYFLARRSPLRNEASDDLVQYPVEVLNREADIFRMAGHMLGQRLLLFLLHHDIQLRGGENERRRGGRDVSA